MTSTSASEYFSEEELEAIGEEFALRVGVEGACPAEAAWAMGITLRRLRSRSKTPVRVRETVEYAMSRRRALQLLRRVPSRDLPAVIQVAQEWLAEEMGERAA
jgi:hypothetical protein